MTARRAWIHVLLLSFSITALAGPAGQVRFAAAGFRRVLSQCPGRLWPGFSFQKTDFLFISPAMRTAWRITRHGSAEAGALSRWPLKIRRTSDFQILPANGRTLVAVNLDHYSSDGISLPFAVAVHEFFHWSAQADWSLPASGRGDFFPLSDEARYQRAMLLKALKAVARGHSHDLSEASTWYQRWAKNYPEELKYSTDLREGTARYVEQTAVALSQVGCAATAQRLDAARDAWVDRLSPADMIGLDGEGYSIGALAVLLLDRENPPGWRTRLAQGQSPLQVLLDSVPPSADVPGDPALERKLSAAVGQANAQAGRWIVPFESDFESASALRVVIPASWSGQVISLQGQFVSRQDERRKFSLFAPGQEFGRAQSWLVATDGLIGLKTAAAENPCGYDGWIFVFPPSALKRVRAGRIVAHAENLDFEIKAPPVADGYLCPFMK